MVRSVAITLSASCVLVLAGCGAGGSASGSNYSYQNITVTLTPQISSLAAGQAQSFSATVANAPPTFSWQTFGTVGTISQQTTSSNTSTVTFTAPSSPPVYSQKNVAGDVSYNDSTTQGIIVLSVGVPAGLNTFSQVTATEKFPVTGTVSAGIAPTTASVKLGATLTSFTGYCVGASNNTVVWQVNGVTGGSMSVGTIAANATGGATYNAPATMPMTGSTVTVAGVCQADSTKTATSTVTLM